MPSLFPFQRVGVFWVSYSLLFWELMSFVYSKRNINGGYCLVKVNDRKACVLFTWSEIGTARQNQNDPATSFAEAEARGIRFLSVLWLMVSYSMTEVNRGLKQSKRVMPQLWRFKFGTKMIKTLSSQTFPPPPPPPQMISLTYTINKDKLLSPVSV